MLGHVAGALDRFWFAPGSPTRLAVLRILIGTGALLYFGSRFWLFSEIAGSSPKLFAPAGVVGFLDGPLPVVVFQAVVATTILANVAFILGWRFAWSGPLFAFLLLATVSYRNSWSMIYHTDNLVVLHVLILGLTRSADALSLDALRWPARSEATVRPTTGRSARVTLSGTSDWHWEYGYPVRLLCAMVVIVYVLSGIAKIVGPLGWTWALGEGLRSQVAFDALRKELLIGSAQPLAYVVYNNLILSTGFGVGALVLELGAIVALLHARAGRFWAVGAYLMHCGIYAIMGIMFWYQLSGLAYTPFLIGEGLVAWSGLWLSRLARARALVWPFRRVSGDEPAIPTTNGSPIVS
jgi:hypothetical protein